LDSLKLLHSGGALTTP